MENLIDSWVEENEGKIKNCLETARKKAVDHHQKNPGWNSLLCYLDLKLYDYAEMNICYACENITPPPFHILKKWGGVDGPSFIVDHEYFRYNDHVVCLTPGQFWFLRDHNLNGDTIKRMVATAPKIVRNVRGIYFLSGDYNDIFTKLNLMYS